jgi:hypothetical protein
MSEATDPPAEVTPENVEEILAAHGLHGPGYGLLPHAGALRDEFKTSHKKGVSNEIGIRIDPLHAGNPGFDFETIFASLDGETDEPTTNAMVNDSDRQAALKLSARLLSVLLDWLLAVNLADQRALKSIGVRAVAMAWVINPERFEGASLTTLAKRLGYGSGAAISPEAAEFSRRFGISNHFQAHAPDKEVYEKWKLKNPLRDWNRRAGNQRDNWTFTIARTITPSPGLSRPTVMTALRSPLAARGTSF